MALDWIKDLVSDSDPCGPDLQAIGDPQFMEYYFNAESRLPERYLLPTVFDPSSIKIRDEESRITALLKRSRDLRLLTLLTRFQILAGKARGFAEAAEATADVLELWPEEANPPLATARRARFDALETLASTPWVVMPLQYLPLTGSPEVTLRRYLVASGEASPREDEEEVNPALILDQLRNPGSRAVTEANLAALERAHRAFDRISDLTAEQGRPVDLSRPMDVMERIGTLIREVFPDIRAAAAVAAPEAQSAAQSDTAPLVRPPTIADPPAAGSLSSQAEARATLVAIETYLARNEPSSATLLLVAQARQLVGKPLVTALEALLPADAAKATIDFGPQTGFRMTMERLKALTGDMFEGDAAIPLASQPDPLPPRITTRPELAAHMRSVELWYRQNEPASPIPILLGRARSWLDKDFESILAEVMPMANAS